MVIIVFHLITWFYALVMTGFMPLVTAKIHAQSSCKVYALGLSDAMCPWVNQSICCLANFCFEHLSLVSLSLLLQYDWLNGLGRCKDLHNNLSALRSIRHFSFGNFLLGTFVVV